MTNLTRIQGSDLPRDIDFSEVGDTLEIIMNQACTTANMQDNNAAFEAWALVAMLSDVTATPELLEHWLFDKQAAEILFALVDGKEVGFALYFRNFSTFLGKAGLYLEDLYVLPKYRDRGIGKALLVKLAHISVERGYGRMEWACLDWNEPSIDFYRSIGAVDMSDWTTYRLTGDTLMKLAENSYDI